MTFRMPRFPAIIFFTGVVLMTCCQCSPSEETQTASAIPVSVPSAAKAAAVASPAKGNTYYVSSSAGDDSNPGTEEQPWATLSKISGMVFHSGDTILLKVGDVFGPVTLRGCGTDATPITLASYGGGGRPWINCAPLGSAPPACVTLPNSSQGWRIIGIEMSGCPVGINIDASGGNTYYWFEDDYIHNINNPDWHDPTNPDISTDWLKWGFSIYLTGENTVSDLTIKNCIFSENDCDFWIYGPSLENVLMDGCTVTGCLYNSIYYCAGTGFDIKNCMFSENGTGNISVGVTSIITGGLTGGPDANVVSGCEFSNQHDPGGSDGCAFDFETSSDGITFKDNFIHDCYGEAVLFMPGFEWNNISVSNNIFYQDCNASTVHSAEIDFGGKASGSGSIADNSFIRLPGIRMFSQHPPVFNYPQNADITTPLTSEPEITADAGKNSVTISDSDPDAVIYYTTDGSVPTQSSAKYTGGSVEFTKTSSICAKAFRDGYLPSGTCCEIFAYKAEK